MQRCCGCRRRRASLRSRSLARPPGSGRLGWARKSTGVVVWAHRSPFDRLVWLEIDVVHCLRLVLLDLPGHLLYQEDTHEWSVGMSWCISATRGMDARKWLVSFWFPFESKEQCIRYGPKGPVENHVLRGAFWVRVSGCQREKGERERNQICGVHECCTCGHQCSCSNCLCIWMSCFRSSFSKTFQHDPVFRAFPPRCLLLELAQSTSYLALN